LLDIINNEDSTSSHLSGINNNSALSKLQKSSYKELGDSAGKLNDYASKFSETGVNSLFAQAEKSGSNKDIVANVKNFVDAYNTTAGKLTKTDSTLNKYYLQQMKALVADNADALKKVGITQSKDGTISVDTKTLESASVSDLKTAFGSTNVFSSRIAYVANKVEQNATANMESISSQYTSNGLNAYLNSSSKYDSLG
jgi:signal-transduction protein with cAMP-binding, CBS, and nucleotidyltransferase domain